MVDLLVLVQWLEDACILAANDGEEEVDGDVLVVGRLRSG